MWIALKYVWENSNNATQCIFNCAVYHNSSGCLVQCWVDNGQMVSTSLTAASEWVQSGPHDTRRGVKASTLPSISKFSPHPTPTNPHHPTSSTTPPQWRTSHPISLKPLFSFSPHTCQPFSLFANISLVSFASLTVNKGHDIYKESVSCEQSPPTVVATNES